MALYVRASLDSQKRFFLDVETAVSIFILQISKSHVKLVVKLGDVGEGSVQVGFQSLNFDVVDDVPEKTLLCKWPLLLHKEQVIAGLCAVARQLIKCSPFEEIRQLLGFREAALMSCSETSIWTKFCEVDIISTIKSILTDSSLMNKSYFSLPETILRFEYHLEQPVRMHNMYKVARIASNNKTLESSVPREELNVEHTYGEGPFMTLVDLVLYPCFDILFKMFSQETLSSLLPNINRWFQTVSQANLQSLDIILAHQSNKTMTITKPQLDLSTLYKADVNKPIVSTKQYEIDRSLATLQTLSNEIVNSYLPFGYEIDFNWHEMPLEVSPNAGALPEKRAQRKSQQLENLAKAVIKLAKTHPLKIVDFCSGSGHLGIVLAFLLPNSQIILVENKERSLSRAFERIQRLKLSNIQIVQSNLDYFTGTFDIGVSLHACGVATDLVIETCVQNKAHFVCCPCCYGGIKDCHLLKYPRSERFIKLGLNENYMNIAHAADQTHDPDNAKTKQGFYCMDIIDTDRRFYAESCGFEVFLGKLQPTTCTNKNNLLVGVYKNKI